MEPMIESNCAGTLSYPTDLVVYTSDMATLENTQG